MSKRVIITNLAVVVVLVLLILTTISVFFIRIMPTNLSLEGYGGGWEFKTEIDTVTVNGIEFSADNPPENMNNRWGLKKVYFDPDDPQYDQADLEITVDDPIHKGFIDGKLVLTDTSIPHRVLTKTVNGVTYYYDHHIYTFNVKIETHGDSWDRGDWWWDFIAEAASYSDVVSKVTVGIRIIIDPWQILGQTHTDDETGEQFKVVDAWAGVMQVSCNSYSRGFSDRDLNYKLNSEDSELRDDVNSIVVSGWKIDAFPVSGDPLNMYKYEDDTSLGTGKVFDSADEVVQVPRAIIADVSCDLQAGANGVPQTDLVKPTVYNVFYNGEFRIEMLTARGYAPITGDDPPSDDPDPDIGAPSPFLYPVFDWLSENYGWVAFVVAAIVIVILVVFGILAWMRFKLAMAGAQAIRGY